MTLAEVVKMLNDAGLDAELYLGPTGTLSVFGYVPEHRRLESYKEISRAVADGVCVNLEKGRVCKYHTPERLRADIAASHNLKRYQEILADNERWKADYAAEKAIRDWTHIDTSTDAGDHAHA
jgi:hypothetical protein